MKFLSNVPKWKKFPDTTTLGYYCPLGNYIYLGEYKDKDDFSKATKNPGLDKDRFSVSIHEIQHYYDQVSTLWGIKKVYKIFQAYDAIVKSKEQEFYKLRSLELDFKRDYFLDYYTQTHNKINGDFNNKWQFQITCGVRFSADGKVDNNNPIPFITFSSSSRQLISRVPISTVTLLETTAINSEFGFLISHALKLQPPFNENQVNQISKKFEALLYNHELTLYTAAVHIVSVYLQINDPLYAYQVASFFAKIALNLPDSLFSQIKLESKPGENKKWTDRARQMMINKDRGFAFLTMVKNYADHMKGSSDKVTIENILKASALPNEVEIEKLIAKEIDEIAFNFNLEKNLLNRGALEKIAFGNNFRKETGIGQQKTPSDSLRKMTDMPYLIFSDTDFEYENLPLEPIIQKLVNQQKVSIDEWFRFYTMCETKLDEFNAICGI